MTKKLENAKALYLEGIRDGHVRSAVEAYTGDRYTQHSTGMKSGVEGFVEFFEPFVERNPKRDIRVIRAIEDGQYVFVHVYQDINDGEAYWVTTDMFDTDDNDKMIEHWDVIAPFVGEGPNGRTQVDGPTEVVDLDKTEDNKAMVASFVDDVLVNGRVERLVDYVSSETYTQHNPAIADGIEGLREFMAGPGQTMQYKNVFKIIGQGNFVVVYSLVSFDGDEMAVFDILRVDDGKVVEHWSNMEPIPEGPQPNSGKF